MKRKFIYGPGIDEPVMMIDVTTSTKYYYHFDGLGSVIALSNSSGDIVERYSYDVFGEPNRVSDVNNPYLFTGRRYDPETDNYYYRARYYDPNMGRFLEIDPVGYIDSMNLYTYVLNNPIILIDPMGLGVGGYPIWVPPPRAGKRCCKEWSEPSWKLLGYSSAARCANAVFNDAWDVIGGSLTQLIGSGVGYFVHPVGPGLIIGSGIQWSIAYAVCADRMCTRHGKTDGCGNCK